MKAKRLNKKARATNAIRELRIQAIVQIRLEGAEGWDVASYVSELEAKDGHPWKMEAGGKPLSERQIRRYVEQAGKRIAEICRTHNPNAIFLHLAKLNRLYARSVQAGEIRTARAVLNDLAKLQDLYPGKKVKAEHTDHVYIDNLADLTPGELDAERRRLEKLLADERGPESPASTS